MNSTKKQQRYPPTWSVDKNSRVPLYLQIKDLIKYSISTGAIRRGEKLPGVVELAGDLGVNFETVRKAYKEVEKEGMLSVSRGRGTFAGPVAPPTPSAEWVDASPWTRMYCVRQSDII